MRLTLLSVAVFLTGSVALLQACKTESYCFDDCEAEAGGSGGSAARDGGSAAGGAITGGTGGTGFITGGSAGAPDACAETNAGQEICDGVDNDCDGKTDEGSPDSVGTSVDFGKAISCGTCANDCGQQLGAHIQIEGCEPPTILDGTVKGVCKWHCDPEFYDNNNDPSDGCEYHCQWNPSGTNTTDPGGQDGCTKDDDCDLGKPGGGVDEDVDLCSVNDCGKCGNKCFVNNGTAKCVNSAAPPCNEQNTRCRVDTCDTGFYDIDGSGNNGCEYECMPTVPPNEVCDGKDNDCDAKIDNVDPDLETDPQVNQQCFGALVGVCHEAGRAGITKCIGPDIKCCDTASNNIAATNPEFPATGIRNGQCTTDVVVFPDEIQERCNSKDDDCDGLVDDAAIDVGGVCGSPVGNCQSGTTQCINGTPQCQGAIGPVAEICNGQDDNCDGVIDGTLPSLPTSCTSNTNCATGQTCMVRNGPTDKVCATGPSDAVGACDVPIPPPAGVSTPCRAGTLACTGGVKVCLNSVTATSTVDTCNVDANCDGSLSGQPDTTTDVRNCGTCGNDCYASAPGGHGTFTCTGGVCSRTGCEPGFINCDSNLNDCERSCTFVSAQEQCNGADDDCDCQVDENVPTPSAAQVCGMSPAATDPGCTSVTVACQSGAFRCTFPAGYCNGGSPASCTTTQDVCDGLDNNCNGNTDDNFKPPVLNQGYLTQPCASDDGLPPPGHGACRTLGTYVCNGPNATRCTAVKNNAAATVENCDLQDNDCDGLIDEPFTNKGTNPEFVRPNVTQIAASLWVYQYEASRPGATGTDPGSGNGYHCGTGQCPAGVPAAPAQVPLDRTKACSVPSVVPWFNVTGIEAEQTCNAMGGQLCARADWQTSCQATASCTRGYNPRTGSPAACTLDGTYPSGARVCNIGAFDFDQSATNGNQDGLLPTGSALLSNCWADWAGLQSNPAANDDIRDIEGNLREIVKDSAVYRLMGGAFNTQSEDGAACGFTFYTVDANFKLFDAGFRCCFTQKPN